MRPGKKKPKNQQIFQTVSSIFEEVISPIGCTVKEKVER
jgi:hypothetical protein